jgi:hypothetical protein
MGRSGALDNPDIYTDDDVFTRAKFQQGRKSTTRRRAVKLEPAGLLVPLAGAAKRTLHNSQTAMKLSFQQMFSPYIFYFYIVYIDVGQYVR